MVEFGAWHDFFKLDDGSQVGVYGMGELFNNYDHPPVRTAPMAAFRLVRGYGYWCDVAALTGG